MEKQNKKRQTTGNTNKTDTFRDKEMNKWSMKLMIKSIDTAGLCSPTV